MSSWRLPAIGEDRWVAIACQDDMAWKKIRDVMSFDDLAADNALSSLPGRLAREDDLEARVADWTSQHDAEEVQNRLIESGVAAYVVQDGVMYGRSAECQPRTFYSSRTEFCR